MSAIMNTSSQQIKAAKTEHQIEPLLLKRWSPRSFSEQAISVEQLHELFEAASWAASANNEQPWKYVYALKGTPAFEQLWETLKSGNQPWAKDAAALVVSLQRNTFQKNGNPNGKAMHDVGMANAQLVLQAAARDIYAHMMGGYEREPLKALLAEEETVEPVVVIALGYLGEAEALEEPYKSRELAPRTRIPVKEFTRAL